jgi:hypothetical protein
MPLVRGENGKAKFNGSPAGDSGVNEIKCDWPYQKNMNLRMKGEGRT